MTAVESSGPIRGELVPSDAPAVGTTPPQQGQRRSPYDTPLNLDGRVKLTREVFNTLMGAFRAGASVRDAFALVAVDRWCHPQWLKRGRAYLKRLEEQGDGAQDPHEEVFGRYVQEFDRARATALVAAHRTVNTIMTDDNAKTSDRLKAAVYLIEREDRRKTMQLIDPDDPDSGILAPADITEQEQRLARSLLERKTEILAVTSRVVTPRPEPEPDPYEPWAATMGLATPDPETG